LSERRSLYEEAGGDDAFVAFAAALHDRCLGDPVLFHPFSQTSDPDHVQHLASYLAEVLGGPTTYSANHGGHSAMLEVHAATGAYQEMADRFVVCFDLALDDARWPEDPEFRQALHDYVVWATTEVQSYAPIGTSVHAGQAMPRWSWDGLTP
jgi:hemoglobin